MPSHTPSHASDDDPGGALATDRALVVHVVDGAGAPRELATRLADAIPWAGRVVGAFGEARVRLVRDAEMAQAHEEFAGVPGTTDVLTFDLTDPEDDPIDGPTVALRGGAVVVSRRRLVDADILVCVDEAERQATLRGHDVFRELLLYAIHGVLHCLGHDDHDEASFEAMHGVEDAVLAAMGVGPVFAREGGGGAG